MFPDSTFSEDELDQFNSTDLDNSTNRSISISQNGSTHILDTTPNTTPSGHVSDVEETAPTPESAVSDDAIDIGEDYAEALERQSRGRKDHRLQAKGKSHKQGKVLSEGARDMLKEAAASNVEADVFTPTYQGSRHEREMILSSLSGFYHDHMILDVLRVVKAGKEATVYVCKANPQTGVTLLAGKIYRPRMFRNLKDDAAYRVGTQMRDTEGKVLRKAREQRAVAKRSKVGLNMLHNAWLSNEIGVMNKLFAAGAIVPKPFTSNENAILMEYLGDEGQAAPPLGSATLTQREAHRLFQLLLDNIKIMLANDVVHGDLSAFNILYHDGQARIIDFPQAVNPFGNPHAFKFYCRDVERVCDYFERYGIDPDPLGLAQSMWQEVLGINSEQLREIQRARSEKAAWNAQ